MVDNPRQFSLKYLLFAVVLFSLILAIAVNQIGLALIVIVLELPFFLGGFITHLLRSPRIARAVILIVGTLVIFAGFELFILANRNHEISANLLIAVGMLCGYGFVCGLVAWLLPYSVS